MSWRNLDSSRKFKMGEDRMQTNHGCWNLRVYVCAHGGLREWGTKLQRGVVDCSISFSRIPSTTKAMASNA